LFLTIKNLCKSVNSRGLESSQISVSNRRRLIICNEKNEEEGGNKNCRKEVLGKSGMGEMVRILAFLGVSMEEELTMTYLSSHN